MAAPVQYSPLQMVLHWITALMVIVMVPMGFYMVWRYFATDNDALTVGIFDVHKLLGFLLLWLVVARLGVRIAKGVPPPAASMTRWQRMAAETTHRSIYGLLVVVPLTGWAGASAYGLRSLPGGIQLPEIVAKNTNLAGQILWWHGWGAIALAAAAVAHIAAALLHRYVFKDGVFERMWPFR